ncbi:aminotransferase, partial [Streptococcus gallolyticus subsp. gallolyticus]|nr:aminotransferase [Streptococcus gallolyticus subsp. gallolyticus]
YTMICAGVFDDMVASLALEHKEAILARNRHIIRENLAILDQWIASESKASYIRPAEVPTSFVKLDVNVPIETFCLTLLQKYGVLLVPGNRFDREGYVRLGYSCQQETLKQGLQLLSACLKEF